MNAKEFISDHAICDLGFAPPPIEIRPYIECLMEAYARHRMEDFKNMLEDVVNELDLSEVMIEKHGQEGTPPSELVRLVLKQKDKQIAMLKAGMKQI